MSLAASLRTTLSGDPTPPGRYVAPGQAMPAYQPLPVAPWDGAARGVPNAPTPTTITKHVNMPSNMPVMSHHVIRPWRNGEHNQLREGQLSFIARVAGKPNGRETFDHVATEVSFQHLQSIAARCYAQAMQDLAKENLPGVAKGLTLERFLAISEADIEEYMGSPEREASIPKDDMDLYWAVKLLHVGHFKYLRTCSLRLYWNQFGGINNTSVASSPENKVSRGNGETVVVNNAVAKKTFLSNFWGGKDKVSEGCHVGLILKRGNGETRVAVGAPEFVPWSDRDLETPPLCDRMYYDEYNRPQMGHYIPLGVVLEVTGEVPAERKRREAIGNGNQNPAIVHDAVGTLPQIVVGLGHY